MSRFKAEMHQIRFLLGLSAPDDAKGAYHARLGDPLSGFKTPSF